MFVTSPILKSVIMSDIKPDINSAIKKAKTRGLNFFGIMGAFLSYE